MRTTLEAIDIALSRRIPFYAYCMPGCDGIAFGAQADNEFKCEEGFKIVPFDISSNHSTKIIYKQLNASALLTEYPEKGDSLLPGIPNDSTSRSEYMQSIGLCIEELQAKKLSKVVLSKVITRKHSIQSWGKFFGKLCNSYPDAFKFLFFSEETGAWAGASPETLGSYDNSTFTTMALAGTRKCGTSGDWDDKDTREQEYVAQYIADTIRRTGIDFTMSGRFTKQAGGVEHLCNLFSLQCTLRQAHDLIAKLHPTPALAGLLKQKAIELIHKAEHHDREYYGGYIGPFSPDEFHYYVNLRSMKFDNGKCRIFVGGGIVSDSVPESEWLETEAKSKTLLALLPNDKQSHRPATNLTA